MSEGILNIKDSRTSREYEIPVRHNTILATDLKKIKSSNPGASEVSKVGDGLRVFDPGLKNTCVIETDMSYAYVPSPAILPHF